MPCFHFKEATWLFCNCFQTKVANLYLSWEDQTKTTQENSVCLVFYVRKGWHDRFVLNMFGFKCKKLSVCFVWNVRKLRSKICSVRSVRKMRYVRFSQSWYVWSIDKTLAVFDFVTEKWSVCLVDNAGNLLYVVRENWYTRISRVEVSPL